MTKSMRFVTLRGSATATPGNIVTCVGGGVREILGLVAESMLPVGVLRKWGASCVGPTSVLCGITRRGEEGWSEGTGSL